MTFGIITISITALDVFFYAGCRLCRESFMLSVANKPLMFSVIMLNALYAESFIVIAANKSFLMTAILLSVSIILTVPLPLN